MKNIIAYLLLVSAAFTNQVFAQKLTLVKTEAFPKTENNNKHYVCYDKAVLQPISDAMFKAGNPKYIWVDLLMDGYINEGDNRWHNLHLYVYESTANDSLVPLAVQIAYIQKWKRFVASLHEPLYEYGFYNLQLLFGINGEMLFNPGSELRKVSQLELSNLHLTHNGHLRFYNELVKDGLASYDKALDLKFSSNGFFVYGKRLDYELRTKYMTLLNKEFGYNCYNDGSSLAIGSYPENTLGKKIAKLEEQINNAAQKTNQ